MIDVVPIGALFAGEFLIKVVSSSTEWHVGEAFWNAMGKFPKWVKGKEHILKKALMNTIDDVVKNNEEFEIFKSEFEEVKNMLKRDEHITDKTFEHSIGKQKFCELLKEANIPHEHLDKVHEAVQKRFVHYFIKNVSDDDIADAVEILFEESLEVKKMVKDLGDDVKRDSKGIAWLIKKENVVYDMLKTHCDNDKTLIEKIDRCHEILSQAIPRILESLKRIEQKIDYLKEEFKEEFKNINLLLHQLTSTKHDDIIDSERFFSLKNTIVMFQSVDSIILPLVRSHRDISSTQIKQSYKNQIAGELSQRNIDTNALFSILYNPSFSSAITNSVIEPDIVVYISDDLQKIEFEFDNTKIVVEHPLLIWDCHCKHPYGDFERFDLTRNSEDIPCPIHGTGLGVEANNRFHGGGIVEFRYSNLKVYWRNSKDFWPPSIDSIYMLNNLIEDGILNKEIKSILDVGCGTGFLGIFLTKKCKFVRELYFSDWLITPAFMSRLNWEVNKEDKKYISCKSYLGLDFDWINVATDTVKLDLCICNPPYLPTLGFAEVELYHTVSGTALLENFIREGLNHGKEAYINISNIAFDEANIAAESARCKLKPIGIEHRIPFRVRAGLRSQDYMHKLVEQRDLEEEDSGRYRFWHKIRTYKIVEG